MSASTLGGSDPTNRALYNVETATAVDTMNSVDQTWGLLEDFGDILTRYTRLSLFFRSLYGGLFIGIGGILTASGSLTTQSHNYTTYHPVATHNPPFPSPSLPSSHYLSPFNRHPSVGCDIASGYPWLPGCGFQRFLSGAVGFPLAIILSSSTGCGTWTGDMLMVSRSLFSKTKKTNLSQILRFGLLTWFGCLCGTFIIALLATHAALPCINPCLAIVTHKLDYSCWQMFCRGILGGTMFCLATFLSKLNREMIGKVVCSCRS